MKKLLILITLGTLLLSCGNNNNLSNSSNTNNDVSSSNDISKKEILITSIPPLKWLVQKIAGDNFEVISIIQPNMNHELFDPKPNDLKALENSKLFFTYNILSFENKISNTVTNKEKIANLLENLDKSFLLENNDDDHGHESKDDDHSHEEFDPHIWFSLELMPQFANDIKNKLIEAYPDKKEVFEKNHSMFLSELNNFKTEIDGKINNKTKKYFMIYHPSLGYFLKNYNIKEISIEYQGKEPSAKQIKEIIIEAKKHNVSTILVQPQFAKQSIEAISKEISNSKIIEFNADEENVFENLRKLVDNLE